jgi:hypothetical protein
MSGTAHSTRPGAKRVAFAFGGSALTLVAVALMARRFSGTSWPLAHANPTLVGMVAFCFVLSFFMRGLAWQSLFQSRERPCSGSCIASVGAAAASGSVLPFRLDFAVKIAAIRKLGRTRAGLDTIALSIVSLGIVDAAALAPLSVGAAAFTKPIGLRVPLAVTALAGIGAVVLLVLAPKLLEAGVLQRTRFTAKLARRLGQHQVSGRRTFQAWLMMSCCWCLRLLGFALLLAAVGIGYTPQVALAVICFGAVAALVPGAGSAVSSAGAGAALLLALNVPKEAAINLGLSSGILLTIAALVAAVFGSGLTFARRRWPLAFERMSAVMC